MSIRPVLIGIRDVRLFLADRGDLAFSLLLPIALLVLMLAAFPDTTEINTVGYIVDADGGPSASALVERLEDVPGLRLVTLDGDDAQQRLDGTEILLYARIPPGYSDAIAARGTPPPVEIHRRGNGGQEGQIFIGYVLDASDRVAAPALLQPAFDDLVESAGVEVPAEARASALAGALQAAETSPPVAVRSETVGGERGIGVQLFPNLATMFVVFSITLNATAFVEERRRGTIERLLTTRLTLTELFAGTFLGNFFRGFLQLSILFLLGAAAFGFLEPRVLLVGLLFSVLIVSASAALGLLLSAIARTVDQARWGSVFLTALMGVFGGTFVAGDDGLGGLDTVARFTLNYWANRGFRELLLDEGGVVELLPEMGIIAAVAVVLLILSRVFLRPSALGRR